MYMYMYMLLLIITYVCLSLIIIAVDPVVQGKTRADQFYSDDITVST